MTCERIITSPTAILFIFVIFSLFDGLSVKAEPILRYQIKNQSEGIPNMIQGKINYMPSFKRTTENPKKEFKQQKRGKALQRKKKKRKRFIAVDVWQTQFGPVSERAVYDVFAQTFGIETHNLKKYSFPDCVNALRKLEDPTYQAPSYGSGTV